jgi:hypothetical protein
MTADLQQFAQGAAGSIYAKEPVMRHRPIGAALLAGIATLVLAHASARASEKAAPQAEPGPLRVFNNAET